MRRTTFGRQLLVWVSAAVLLALSTPVAAQQGQGNLRGKVVDEAGKPVGDAEVIFDIGDVMANKTTTTNSRGEFTMRNIQVGSNWVVTARKGTLIGQVQNIEVRLRATIDMPDIVIRGQGAGAARPASAAELKARAELQALFTAAEAAVTAGNYDEAIAKLNEVAGKTQGCAECLVRIGEVQLKKNDQAAAEAAFLKAAEINTNFATAYDALANLYNSQRKFDEAVAMSTKANAARAASGGAAAGGGDATALYNAGVIFWNQGKIAEAREQFQKAVDADPKMAEAHYQLGMTLLNENKQPEAKAALQKYLDLAPTGQNAETAKAILSSLK